MLGMYDWWEPLILGLATRGVVAAWNDEQGIFGPWRETLIAWGESPTGERSRSARFRARIAQLATCSFCQSYHVAFWLGAGMFGPQLFLAGDFWALGRFLVSVFAGATVAHLLTGFYAKLIEA